MKPSAAEPICWMSDLCAIKNTYHLFNHMGLCNLSHKILQLGHKRVALTFEPQMGHKQFPRFIRWIILPFIIHSAVAIPNSLQAISPLCERDLFGTPHTQDCYQAMFWVPYINPPARDSPDAKAPRNFAEPQYLDPPFSAVKNAYAPKAIVQLPKIWKFSTSLGIRGLPNNAPFPRWRCLVTSLIVLTSSQFLLESCIIALVPQPYIRGWPRHLELKPIFRAKWSDVVNTVLRIRPCLSPRAGPPSGGYTPLLSRSTFDRHSSG